MQSFISVEPIAAIIHAITLTCCYAPTLQTVRQYQTGNMLICRDINIYTYDMINYDQATCISCTSIQCIVLCVTDVILPETENLFALMSFS